MSETDALISRVTHGNHVIVRADSVDVPLLLCPETQYTLGQHNRIIVIDESNQNTLNRAEENGESTG